MSNLIVLEFYDKKSFPPGKWISEPDFCSWEHRLPCLAIRDMAMGIWRGFVGIDEEHPFYGKPIEDLIKNTEALEIFFTVHGGISGAGRLPTKFKEYAKNYWWLGIETSHGGDLAPLLKSDMTTAQVKMIGNQTYKDFKFIRKEVNKLATCLFKVQ